MSNIEKFRVALMEKHSDDWDMETIAEAAHICAEALETEETKANKQTVKETLLTILREARRERAKENSWRWRNNRQPVDSAWFSRLLRRKVDEL